MHLRGIKCMLMYPKLTFHTDILLHFVTPTVYNQYIERQKWQPTALIRIRSIYIHIHICHKVNICAQHSFSTHERFFWKCQHFLRDEKYLDLRGTRTPNLRIHAECSNHFSYQGQAFAAPSSWILALATNKETPKYMNTNGICILHFVIFGNRQLLFDISFMCLQCVLTICIFFYILCIYIYMYLCEYTFLSHVNRTCMYTYS